MAFIRSASAVAFGLLALDPRGWSSSSSLTSANVSLLTSTPLHTRKVAGSIPAGTTGVIIEVSGLKTPFGGPRIPLGNRRHGAKLASAPTVVNVVERVERCRDVVKFVVK